MSMLRLMTGVSCIVLSIGAQSAAQTTSDHQTPVQASNGNGSTSLTEVVVTASRFALGDTGDVMIAFDVAPPAGR